MRTAAVVVVLAAIWVLLWGSASIANVVTGVLVGTALVMLVPGLRGTQQPLVIRPIAVLRLLGHFVTDLVRSNVVLTREIITRRSHIHTAIVGVELPGCSDELLTAITNMLALAPGTMPVDLTLNPTVLYVHVLHLEDVEQVRRDVRRLTELALAAFGTPEGSAS
jgi:multicomponent Na+:H+ antiporter subunit E